MTDVAAVAVVAVAAGAVVAGTVVGAAAAEQSGWVRARELLGKTEGGHGGRLGPKGS